MTAAPTDGVHLEVTYAAPDEMAPDLQRRLVSRLEQMAERERVSVLFEVKTLDVPLEVPRYWQTVTGRLAPRLCAIAIVSDSLAVRVAGMGFSISTRLRHVPVVVKAFTSGELEVARQWCLEVRAAAPAQ